MTWAARYSPTKQPELTIWRDGVEVIRESDLDFLAYAIGKACTFCRLGSHVLGESDVWRAVWHDPDLRADIAARVPPRECEETQACTRHAMPDGRCREHGGRDEL